MLLYFHSSNFYFVPSQRDQKKQYLVNSDIPVCNWGAVNFYYFILGGIGRQSSRGLVVGTNAPVWLCVMSVGFTCLYSQVGPAGFINSS